MLTFQPNADFSSECRLSRRMQTFPPIGAREMYMEILMRRVPYLFWLTVCVWLEPSDCHSVSTRTFVVQERASLLRAPLYPRFSSLQK